MNSAEGVDRLQVCDPGKEKRRSSVVLEAWPLRTGRVLTLSMALLVTQRSDHWTYRAVQILTGHRGPILTEPRLCRQSHSTWRIYRGNGSINSWLHNWFTATEKKTDRKGFFFLSFCMLVRSAILVTQETVRSEENHKIKTLKRDGITLEWGMQTMTNFWWVSIFSNLAKHKYKISDLSFLVANKFEFLTCPLVPFSQDTQLVVCPITLKHQPLIPSAFEQANSKNDCESLSFLFGFLVGVLIMSVVREHEKHSHLSVSFIWTA